MKKYIFNHEQKTSATSFNIPNKDNLDNILNITLVGQTGYEVTTLQSMHYEPILSNHSNLEIVDDDFLEVVMINNDETLTQEQKDELLKDKVMVIEGEEVSDEDLDRLGLSKVEVDKAIEENNKKETKDNKKKSNKN